MHLITLIILVLDWVSYTKPEFWPNFLIESLPNPHFRKNNAFILHLDYTGEIYPIDLGDLPPVSGCHMGIFGAYHSWKLNTQKPAKKTDEYYEIYVTTPSPPQLPKTKNNQKKITTKQLTWHQDMMISQLHHGCIQELIDLAPGPQLNGFLLYQQKQRLGFPKKRVVDGSELQG